MNAYPEVEFSGMLSPAKNLEISNLAFQIIFLHLTRHYHLSLLFSVVSSAFFFLL